MTAEGQAVHRLISVGAAIAIEVAQAGQFTALCGVQCAIHIGQTQGFMQAVCKPAIPGRRSAGHVRIVDRPDFSPPGGGSQASRGQGGQAADFQLNTFRNR